MACPRCWLLDCLSSIYSAWMSGFPPLSPACLHVSLSISLYVCVFVCQLACLSGQLFVQSVYYLYSMCIFPDSRPLMSVCMLTPVASLCFTTSILLDVSAARCMPGLLSASLPLLCFQKNKKKSEEKEKAQPHPESNVTLLFTMQPFLILVYSLTALHV